MQTAFPDGGVIFQQDLAPCHVAKNVKKMLVFDSDYVFALKIVSCVFD